ncbi:528_t:CDS:2, partial [Dentiscutata erythropus]
NLMQGIIREDCVPKFNKAFRQQLFSPRLLHQNRKTRYKNTKYKPSMSSASEMAYGQAFQFKK